MKEEVTSGKKLITDDSYSLPLMNNIYHRREKHDKKQNDKGYFAADAYAACT